MLLVETLAETLTHTDISCLVLEHTFRLELLLGHQIYWRWHGHGRHTESSRQCFHRPCHHPQPGPSLTCPEPLAPRRRASKWLVITTLQGRGEERGQTIGLFSAMLCQIKAAARAVTSSSRRSVPKANRLLNSLSRTCRACKNGTHTRSADYMLKPLL